ncbi:DNA mismatch repair protein MLH3 isoform X3 [Magnolia sinica]|uniref:DNA mismatch repair protein MLH3 isoform X3 n=1 Tax=Magnolia sinica TaxID=86752 RepID=UPI00265920FB|nr:DNA mismatch repair protein MLH3 isoform X3 [Magnolia sinica]
MQVLPSVIGIVELEIKIISEIIQTLHVYVSINIGACYVKVEDDGCGISRDGLVLLGEKYATSKLQFLDEMDAGIESLGFRGVALGSLSDVSLLEIITKARGRSNGYRKIIKGCKCLFLGIDDHRQDVGTTVIVRDLFYNQPVRRRCMQSSPKKVLHLVKKCVLRTALVCPQVSFKVIDVENENELLCTIPSLSPLPLLTSWFGNEVSSSLHEVNFSEGVLKLSGYLSGHSDTFSTKTFQYVYINSRFVCKGPIHKMINNMAASSECSLALWKGESELQNRRRHKMQAYIAYMLNLCCPQSSYDLTFEPSKTIVEFKDWPPILSFIEQAVRHFWRRIPSHFLQGEPHDRKNGVPAKGEMWKEDENPASLFQDPFSADLSRNSDINKKKGKIQHHQTSVNLNPSTSSLKMSSPEVDLFSHLKSSKRPSRKSHMMSSPEVDLFSHQKNCKRSSRESHANAAEHKECQRKAGFIHQTEYSFQDTTPAAWDVYGTKCSQMVAPISSIPLTGDIDFFPVEDHFLSEGYVMRHATEDNEEDDILGSRWRNGSLEVDGNLREGSTGSIVTINQFDYKDDAGNVPFPFHQSKRIKKDLIGNSQSALFSNDRGFEINFDDFRTEKQQLSAADTIDAVETHHSNSISDFFTKNPWQDKLAASHLSRVMRKCQRSTELNVQSSDFTDSRACDIPCFAEENDLRKSLLAEVGERGSDCQSTNSEWCFLSSSSGPDTSLWKVEDFSDGYAIKGNFTSRKTVRSGHFRDPEMKDNFFSHYTLPNSPNEEDHPTSSCIKTELDYKKCFSHGRNVHKFLRNGCHSDDIIFREVGSSDELNNEKDWLCMDLSNTHTMNNYAITSCCILSPNYGKMGKSQRDKLEIQNGGEFHIPKVRSRRSCSAPPFYKGKSKFSLLYNHLNTAPGREPNAQLFHDAPTLPVTVCEFKDSLQPCLKPNLADNSRTCPRTSLEEKSYNTDNLTRMQGSKGFDKSQSIELYKTNALEEFLSSDLENSKVTLTKWRDGGPHPTDGDKSSNLAGHEDGILDISSGLLHLSGGSLQPESIHKDCLQSAKVLLQLDKKFIPVVAGGILAIIDQHAADERIRLEELRRKVLSGEGKTVVHLDSEQELILPEIGFQLLQTYAEQIRNWGWICNIHSQGLGSFSKNLNLLHRQPFIATLAAVPCILGINLSDKDLVEFLQQLAETDGSSTTPPAVLRILNFKACRGAIMFGDSLLPSECSLIVEELKETSLCFQCAHGRPTTVPIVNLEALHKQLAKLGLQNGGSTEQWHGLQRHRPTLERAKRRLSSACNQ